ncbi:MAG TPA: hypothetical protein VGN48_02645 [Pedococcus sp.]|jgi:hypothetical protein|nr:hypothetical protein [Pedococcus sp.]
MSRIAPLPDIVPVLSAGRHRNPRKGACFMEMASFLAGERWSDHPKCTHPLLASLARMVNDCLTDADRPLIVGRIPDVVGLTSEAFEVDVAIATRAAAAALPVAPASRQNVMAVGLLTCQRALAGLGAGHEELHGLCRAAFDAAPDAHAWALRYARDARTSERTFRRQTAPHVVSYAVEGIAASTVDQPSTLLVKLLEECIDDTARRVDRAGSVSAPWHEEAAASR